MQSTFLRGQALLPRKQCPPSNKVCEARTSTTVTRRCKTASNARSVQRRRVTTMGLPIVPIALIGYSLGAVKLWGGFGRTTFEADKKAQLTALWPILFVASESFRANFKRALSE